MAVSWLGPRWAAHARLVIELPHEMTPVQRLLLTRDFFKSYEDLGLPYWAAIHAPNKHNDSRNYHVRINLYNRPAKKIEHPEETASGEMIWDFTYVKHSKTLGHRGFEGFRA